MYPDRAPIIVIVLGLSHRADKSDHPIQADQPRPTWPEASVTAPSAAQPNVKMTSADGDQDDRTPRWSDLTPRELAVASLVSRAMTNQQIARRLNISTHTVNFHLRHVFRKLQIRSRVDLALLARTREQTSRLARDSGKVGRRPTMPNP